MGSGSPPHFHGDAWNLISYGRKRWFFQHPKDALFSKAKVVELSTEGLLVAAEKVTVSCAAELEKATSRGSGVRVDSTTTLKRAKFPTAPRMTEALRR